MVYSGCLIRRAVRVTRLRHGRDGRASAGGATVPGMSPDLDAPIAGATVDCYGYGYGYDEQLTGLFALIDENLAILFGATALGVPVTVTEVEFAADGRIVAR